MNISGKRILIFGVFGVIVIVGVIAYALRARDRMQRDANTASVDVQSDEARLASLKQQPRLVFRNAALGSSYGVIAVVPLTDPSGPRLATALHADRVYCAPDGSGFFLRANRRAITTYEGTSFDAAFQARKTFPLAGAPSRTRVSRSGRFSACTVFVSGDSYNTGGFSTRTSLFDLRAGARIADLEEFAVEKDGKPFKETDFNFWGVTFARDEDRFYATLASGGVIYLVEGRVAARTAKVLRTGVECPSLSPDEDKIAFKARFTENGRREWRFHVLDLKSQKETTVAETHNVDDQAEWFDSDSILYALPRAAPDLGHSDIWKARADGTGAPVLLVKDATSPCVVRP